MRMRQGLRCQGGEPGGEQREPTLSYDTNTGGDAGESLVLPLERDTQRKAGIGWATAGCPHATRT